MPPRVITVTLNPAIDRTLLLDHWMPGAVHRVREPELPLEAGGKGINAARVLAMLGVPCAVAGWLGADNANVFEAAFSRHGIVDDMVRVPGATRCNLKLTDLHRCETTEVNFSGIALDDDLRADAEAALMGRLQARLVPGVRVLLAGSLPPRTDARTWRRLAAFLGERGVAWLADVAASALGDLVADLPRRWMPVLAKPNREELQALAGRVLGGPADVANAAQDLLCGPGIRHVLVSLGGEGVVAVGPEGRWHVPALPAPAGIHSTSGAGDTLLAGTLAAWDGSDGAGWGEAVRFGMACAAWRLQGPASALPPWPVLREQADRLTPHPV